MKLTAMQIAEAKKCKSPEEVVNKAKERGTEMTLEEAKDVLNSLAIMELDEEELAAVSGGSATEYLPSVPCGHCSNTVNYSYTCAGGTIHKYVCSICGWHTVYKGKKYLDKYDPNNCMDE